MSGQQCLGDETTETYGRGSACLAGQYLVTVDDTNTCDTAGVCSTFKVTPIVAELEDVRASVSGYSLFDVDSDATAQRVLQRAIATSTVERFAPQLPSLSQIFKEVIQ